MTTAVTPATVTEVLARTLSGLPAESAAALRALAVSHGADHADPV